MDRAAQPLGLDAAVGVDTRGPAPALVEQHIARAQQPALDHGAERDARRIAPAGRFHQRGVFHRHNPIDAPAGDLDVVALTLDADPPAPQPLRHRAGGAGAEERIEHQTAGFGRGENHPVQQRLGLLGRMRLAPASLEPLRAAAHRQQPVAPHLHPVVEGFHRLVVETGAGAAGAFCAPDQGLVGIGEAGAAEVRHRVGLAPDHVVQDPVAEVLQDGADPVDVVVGADHPERAVVLQHAPRRAQPGAGEVVIGCEVGELVPPRVDAVDAGVVGPVQLAAELQVIGRVREHHIDAAIGQRRHLPDAVAGENLVARDRLFRRHRDAT